MSCRRELRFPTISEFCRDSEIAPTEMCLFNFNVHYIVCKESEKDVLVSVLKQFGSAGRIQSVITLNELDAWYEKALRGEASNLIGNKILQRLEDEIKVEFPSTTSEFADFFKERGYDTLSNFNF